MFFTLMESAITFKKCTFEKVAFIILNLVDLSLTVFAVSQGAYELNPFMRSMLNNFYLLYTTKLVIPMFLGWLLPGKLLIPAIAVLCFVVGWDTRELIRLFI